MDCKFSVVVSIDGAVSTAKIVEALRRQADALEGNHNTSPITGTSKAAAPVSVPSQGPVAEAPAAKPAKAKAPKAEKPKEEKFEVAPAPGLEEDLDLDTEEMDLDGTPTLTLADHVLPAFKAHLTKRAKVVGADAARAEISSLMKSKFGVASGRVVDLDSKNFQAAMDAIK